MVEEALRSPYVAVDANFLWDLEIGQEEALDCLAALRESAVNPIFVIPPTVIQELAYEASTAKEPDRSTAALALRNAVQVHRFSPVNLVPAGHGIVEQIADELRRRDIIPWEEKNDALILSEAALLECKILITSDRHLTDPEHSEIEAVLNGFDVGTPIIAWPQKLISMFGRQ